jgi:hypothetical protein
LGCDAEALDRTGMWAELRLGSSMLAIHLTHEPLEEPPRRLELTLAAWVPLEEIVVRLEAAGIALAEPIVDEAFGRTLKVLDPDGLPISISEHDRELYT